MHIRKFSMNFFNHRYCQRKKMYNCCIEMIYLIYSNKPMSFVTSHVLTWASGKGSLRFRLRNWKLPFIISIDWAWFLNSICLGFDGNSIFWLKGVTVAITGHCSEKYSWKVDHFCRFWKTRVYYTWMTVDFW